MHIGHQDDVHYAVGYCGSGVGMASYLGMRLGQQVAGLAEGKQRSIICRFLHDHFIVATHGFYQLWLAGISGVIAGNASEHIKVQQRLMPDNLLGI